MFPLCACGGQESIAGGQAALLREPVSALSLPPWGPGHGRITSFLRCPSLGLIFCSNCVPLNIFCIPWLSPLSLDRCKLGSRGVRAFLSDMARQPAAQQACQPHSLTPSHPHDLLQASFGKPNLYSFSITLSAFLNKVQIKRFCL